MCNTISNSGSQVDVSGTQNANRGHTSHRGNGGGPNADRDPSPDDTTLVDTSGPCTRIICRDDVAYEVVDLSRVTLADLVSFVPARPALAGEPEGVGVVGMATNVVARASSQDIAGTLFGHAVVVRFVPAGFRFSYGDGTTRTSRTGGASWTALRQADFTPTATSHVYAQRGTYSAGVTVLYSASVDVGNGWIPVDGYVEATTSGYRIRVVEVHTALVDKTCLENPGGPGC